jgi:hypothetical protein
MQRDMDLIRAILLHVESIPADDRVHTVHIEGYSDPIVAKHIELLADAGFVESDLLTTETHGAMSGRVLRITWSGYEFLDAARSDTIWHRAKEHVGGKLGSVPVEVLKQVLIKLSSAALGM